MNAALEIYNTFIGPPLMFGAIGLTWWLGAKSARMAARMSSSLNHLTVFMLAYAEALETDGDKLKADGIRAIIIARMEADLSWLRAERREWWKGSRYVEVSSKDAAHRTRS